MRKFSIILINMIIVVLIVGCKDNVTDIKPNDDIIVQDEAIILDSNIPKQQNSVIHVINYETNEDEYILSENEEDAYNNEEDIYEFKESAYDSYTESNISWVKLHLMNKPSKPVISKSDYNNFENSENILGFISNTPYIFIANCNNSYMKDMSNFNGQLFTNNKKSVIYGIGPYIQITAVGKNGEKSTLSDAKLKLVIDLNNEDIQELINDSGYNINDVSLYYKNHSYGYNCIEDNSIEQEYEYTKTDNIYTITVTNNNIESLFTYGGFFLGVEKPFN